MNSELSLLALWGYGLATLGYIALTVHLVHLRRTTAPNRTNHVLISAVALSALWAATGAIVHLLNWRELQPLHEALDALRYGAWFMLLTLLLSPSPTDRSPPPQWRPSRLIFIGGTLIFIGLFCQSLRLIDPLSPVAEHAAHYAGLALVVFGIVLVEQLYRNTTEDSRWNIKPLAIGLVAIFLFDLYYYSTAVMFKQIDEDAFAIRGFAYVFIIPLLILTVYRTRARPLNVTLSKTAVFQTTTLALVGLYLLATSAAGYYVRYLGGSWGGALQMVVLFAALLLLMLLGLSGSMRARLKVLIGKNFFRYRYDYREEWLKFTNALCAENSVLQLGQQVIRGLGNMVESPAGSLWTKDASGHKFIQSARWNFPVSDITEPSNSPMITSLDASGWVLSLEEFRSRPGRYGSLTLPPWLLEVPNAWLVIPLRTSAGMVGFVLLTTSRTPIDLNWEVNDLLKTAGRQAATFLAQMQATEALLESRKFDSFNRMSAFVVHDLKNILTQLSLMVRNAERHADNVEFQKDMLLTVRHAVDRMRQLMLQLREGATPADGFSGVSLDEIARRVQKSKSGALPAVDLKIHDAVSIRGHEERIERVIGHLVQNALDATPTEGKVWMAVRREAGMAQIEVGDTGQGMSADFIRERLFKPFQTTKQGGMGIGAYESRQYIQELGGEIHVESEENVGTCFRVRLPLLEIQTTSDLQQPEMK
ncbi:histidine kinase [Rugosibacter aromaticivorans]|uniref:histidine kinase n=2 Tax=Rugosibacter aromaticivorans TaxID=1565605 RepID=A0A0C5JCW6_9PROT|nr:histidine kinase [Rugosibacter aromaticivorans]TBR15212.1 MAG: PEP-CTERM system histidine kinase PrsK [Rugosibacter sp.]